MKTQIEKILDEMKENEKFFDEVSKKFTPELTFEEINDICKKIIEKIDYQAILVLNVMSEDISTYLYNRMSENLNRLKKEREYFYSMLINM